MKFSGEVSLEADPSPPPYVFDFSDFDTNGNGILTDADAAMTIGLRSFMGEQKFSLTIDISKIEGLGTDGLGMSGTVTLFGVTTLTAGDFV